MAEGRAVLERALYYCPMDTGDLRESGKVKALHGGRAFAGEYVVEVKFGGTAAPYAVLVHENMSARHAPPTRSKYLWQALVDRRGAMAARATRLKAVL